MLLWSPLLVLGGCAPLVIAYPPPTMLPSAMEPLAPRELGVGMGVNAVVVPGNSGPRVMDDQLGSTLVGNFGVGITDDLEVSAAGGSTTQGLTGSLDVAMRIRQTSGFYLGALGGMAGSEASDTWTENGVVDPDDPGAEPTSVKHPYHYGTLAPHLGVRAVWEEGPVHVPVVVRGSYSFAFAPTGLEEGFPMPHYAWIELMSGVLYSPARVVVLGLGTGIRFNTSAAGLISPSAVISTSVTLRFDAPKAAQNGL